MDIRRRTFLRRSTRTAVGMTAAGMWALRRPVRATSPNDKVRIAGIGVGGRGTSLVRGFVDRGDCEIAMIADLDPSRGAKIVDYCRDKQGKAPVRALEYRRALDAKDVDAVIVALSMVRTSDSPWATITTPLDLHLQTAQALLPACEAAGRCDLDPAPTCAASSEA